jgi:hypothetical protein
VSPAEGIDAPAASSTPQNAAPAAARSIWRRSAP